MGCLDIVSRPRDTSILHKKFALNHKCDAVGNTKSYKAWLVVCGNDKMEDDEDKSSTVPDVTVVKLTMFLAVQRGCQLRHFDIQNASPDGKSDLEIYAELPKVV